MTILTNLTEELYLSAPSLDTKLACSAETGTSFVFSKAVHLFLLLSQFVIIPYGDIIVTHGATSFEEVPFISQESEEFKVKTRVTVEV